MRELLPGRFVPLMIWIMVRKIYVRFYGACESFVLFSFASGFSPVIFPDDIFNGFGGFRTL